MRLDKYLCDMGVGSRSTLKQEIRKGFVMVNGELAKKPEQQVTLEDEVSYRGEVLGYATFEYYMLNKPAGTISATEDKKAETVLDLIVSKKRKDLFPVGRLDKDTEGLLLITNDGDLAHRLLAPKKHVDKLYFARIDGKILEEHVEMFQEGMDIGEKNRTLPAKLEILKSEEESEVLITIREGKYHQIKRMVEKVGCEVTYLKRLSMGSLVLDENLKAGEYRPLTEKELERLKR